MTNTRISHLTSLASATRLFMMTLLVALLAVPVVQAQDDQAHKKVYNQAVEAAKAKKYSEAYELYSEAATLAEQAGDDQVVMMSNRVLAQLDRAYGNRAIKGENFEQAIEHAETGIEHNPAYPDNYYIKALALKKLDRIDEAMPAFVEAIEVAEAESDRKVANAARNGIAGHYLEQINKHIAKENPTQADAQQALAYLEEMAQYPIDQDEDADLLFVKAESNKILGNLDVAETLAQQALEVHRGSRTDKAKIYFVLGEVLMQKGDNNGAKSAFQNAAYGDFKARAEHNISEMGD